MGRHRSGRPAGAADWLAVTGITLLAVAVAALVVVLAVVLLA